MRRECDWAASWAAFDSSASADMAISSSSELGACALS